MFTATKDDNISNISNIKNTSQGLRDTAEDAKSDLRDVANKAGRKVREFIHSAGDEISHTKDTVTEQIRAKPVQSSLIALGVGFIMGTLLRRN